MAFVARYPTALLGQTLLPASAGRSLDDEKRRTLKCPRCQQRMTPVRFDGAFYYRHYTEPAESSRCVRPRGESALHRDAKFHLLNALHALIEEDNGVLPVTLDCSACAAPNMSEMQVELRRDDCVDIEVQVPAADVVADVAILRGGVPVVVFEVWATHRVDDPKWKALAALRDLTCIEVDAHELLPKGKPRWGPPRALPATNSSPSTKPCENCCVPAPSPVIPTFCPNESRESAESLRAEANSVLTAAIDRAPALPAPEAQDVERRRPTPIYVDASPRSSPRTRGRVLDYQCPEGGPVRYRLRQPETQYEALVLTVPTFADLEALCRKNGYVLADEQTLLARPKPRSRRYFGPASDD